MVQINNGILLSHKLKKWNNDICSNMDGPGDYHTKWSSQTDKNNIIWCRLYAESKRKMIQMNLFTKQKHSQNRNTHKTETAT